MSDAAADRASRLVLIAGLVTVVAFLARLVPVLRGAGLDGMLGYDDGVYYTGAAALVAGRAPYADFTLLHPPAILLVLAPFATLGRLTSDHVGLAAARLAFMAIGALNAGLVTVIGARTLRPARRWCLPAAAAGGVFYALWYSSIYATRTDLLEGLGSTAVLVALLLVWRREGGSVSGAATWGAGAALGVGASTKIWGVVALAVVAVWVLRVHGRAAAGRVGLGAALAIGVVCGPFFVRAPAAMVRMVVLDQLHRTPASMSPIQRGLSATSVAWNLPWLHPAAAVVLLAVICAVVTVLLAVAWLSGTARLPAALLVADGAVLLASPSYFTHYGELVAAPLALVLAGAMAAAVARAAHWRAPARWALVAGPLVGLVLLEAPTLTHPLGQPIAAARLRRSLAASRCVATDTPSTLAALDALTRALDAHCAVPVDLTGLTYDRDAATDRAGHVVARRANPAFQADLTRYLGSADGIVLDKPPTEILGPRLRRSLARLTVLARSGAVRVYRRG